MPNMSPVNSQNRIMNPRTDQREPCSELSHNIEQGLEITADLHGVQRIGPRRLKSCEFGLENSGCTSPTQLDEKEVRIHVKHVCSTDVRL